MDSNKAYYDGCVEEPRAVGIYAAKGYGLYGMTKTTTATYQLRTHQDRALTHPGCCEVGLGITPTNDLRVATRLNSSPTYKYSYYGFRCASGSH